MIWDSCSTIPWSQPWQDDNFDPCFQQLFINGLVPGTIAALSATILIIGLMKYHFGSLEWQRFNSGNANHGYLLGYNNNDNRSNGRNFQVDDSHNLKNVTLSTRDSLLITLTTIQTMLGFIFYQQKTDIAFISVYEMILWIWASILCVYLFWRNNTQAPSPSPHLRLVYTTSLFVNLIKTRTVILAYANDEIEAFPTKIAIMASISLILFVASFTQQRRWHGRPSDSPADAQNTYPPAPELTASLSQCIFFSWMDPLIWLGYKRPLEPNDVYDLMPEDHSAAICARWKKQNDEYVCKNGSDTRSITIKVFWFFRYELVHQCFWTLGNTTLVFTGPFMLKRILAYMEDTSKYTKEQAFWWVAGLLVGGTLSAICHHQALWIGRKMGLHLKSIIIGEIYAKSLRRRDAATLESSSTNSKDGNSSNTGKVDNNSDLAISTGKITNLMAVDTEKVSEFTAYFHFLYYLTGQAIFAIFMLYQLLGMASIVGMCVLVFLVPIQWWCVKVWKAYQSQRMKASDKRISKTNEILQGVRIIKFFAWEPQFEKQVADVRNGELAYLRKYFMIMIFTTVVFFMAPVFITLSTFTVYTKVMGEQLTASIAFTALLLFKILRAPIDSLPNLISNAMMSKVSLDRIAKFLSEYETPKYELCKITRQLYKKSNYTNNNYNLSDINGTPDIGFINASFSWKFAATTASSATSTTSMTTAELAASETVPLLSVDLDASSNNMTASASNFELCDLSISFPVGKLSIIVGPTGSGKTSMLMALLGEMQLTAGQVIVPGATFCTDMPIAQNLVDPFVLKESVAYVAQQAWLLNDTIRENILFGLPYDEQRYNNVIYMCALSKDIKILKAGDLTEIGERGIILSGGQKQRICLARAIYSPARHVIMDDCLSAVDAPTAKHLYDNCLMSAHMADRTCILVTHSVGLTIKGASKVVVMQEGHIVASGSPEEVIGSGKLSEDSLHEADEDQQGFATQTDGGLDDIKGKSVDIDKGSFDMKSRDQRLDSSSGTNSNDSVNKSNDNNAQSNNIKHKGKLVTDEGWSRGHVQWQVYKAYFKAGGSLTYWIALVMLFIFTQLLLVAQDWWLREWAASYSKSDLPLDNQSIPPGNIKYFVVIADKKKDIGSGSVNLTYFIGVYVAIALASIAVICGRSLMQYWGSLKASRNMHESLLHTVLRAPVRFFDTMPVGRLINRFSKDMETIDQALNPSLSNFLTELISTLAILIVVAVVTPLFIVAAVFIVMIYWVIGVLYISASREIRRFESVTKSPIHTQFGETINGLSTIRAYSQESRFTEANHVKVDNNNRPFIYVWGTTRWLGIRVDITGAFVSFMAGLLALTATGRIDAGLAGLSLSYALNFTEHVLWIARLYSVNEMNLNSVERIVEYLDIKPEAPVSIPGHVPPSEWPASGHISVKDLQLQYAESQPPVIQGISFEVQPCEKIGIVGRTGAGKSTLTLAMFRFMEASAGQISIDGIDISKIGVGDLRSRLTIIPQDPVLFAGTIRSNLDPFNEHGDDELWLALRQAHLLGDEDQASMQITGSIIKPNNGINNQHIGSSCTSTASNSSELVSVHANDIINQDAGNTVTLGCTISDLEMAVAENGSNFSQGQRQLIALARALVKRTKVIILDEATASVDFDTDARIQTTIRNEFADSTLLCIAHRLRTIVDYDKVLVLDQGKIVEYDTPYNLLSTPESQFNQMCLKSGEYDYLFSVAKSKYQQKVVGTSSTR